MKARTVVKYDDIKKWLEASHSKEFLARMAAHRRLHFAIVSPGDAIWTPPGAIVDEATHQGLRGWGLRLSLLVRVAGCRRGWEGLQTKMSENIDMIRCVG